MASTLDDPQVEAEPSAERRKFVFNKLIRDKILARFVIEGTHYVMRKLAGEKLIEALLAKLEEESAELTAEDSQQLLNELADLQEVIDAIGRLSPTATSTVAQFQEQVNTKLAESGSTSEQLREAQIHKREQSGGFDAGIFIETIEIMADNPWVQHFEANSDRYPEIVGAVPE